MTTVHRICSVFKPENTNFTAVLADIYQTVAIPKIISILVYCQMFSTGDPAARNEQKTSSYVEETVKNASTLETHLHTICA